MLQTPTYWMTLLKWWLALSLFALQSHIQVVADIITIKRICRDGNNNLVFFKNVSDSCILEPKIALFGRENETAPFGFIDSIDTNVDNFLHINANIPFNKLWSYVLVGIKNCNGNLITYFSDTILVDIFAPELTIIDSVSVVPETNKVIIGWRKNNTPDFSHFSLFNYNRSDPRVQEVLKDTVYVDSLSGNVNNTQLVYEITTIDSCGNRAAFGNSSHGTIVLSGIADTCKNEIKLSWIGYKGWSRIKQYHVFKSTNAMPYELLVSVSGNVSEYTDYDVIQPNEYKYFVRAEKDTTIWVTSSSNSVFFNIGKRAPNNPITISYVTVEDGRIKIEIEKDNQSNYSFIYLLKENNDGIYEKIDDFVNQNFIYRNDNVEKVNKYRVTWGNICGIADDTATFSNNIVLSLTDGPNIILNWNEYFTWNNGVEKYKVWKKIGENSFINIDETTYNTYTDDYNNENFICYYIEAFENSGNNRSISNEKCYLGEKKIYYPNVISGGVNNRFIFVGVGIDFEKTSLDVYNRYGQKVFSTNGLNNGWFGTNQNGEMLNNDVYFFESLIRFKDNETTYKKGTITIIR